MQSFHNIEKLPGKKHYTGYAAGTVWKITSWSNGWVAVQRDGHSSFRRRTLKEVSEALETTEAYLLTA